ncbi:MAG: inorganic phosphate transporter [Polyangia bacterium]|jgi:PiT family inorganic phosphate transporter|nr:inorganic phosphate transporter [Polyangia bacterium]
MWQLVSSIYLGWALGANDASNVFGTAVASRMLRFWTAAVLAAVFILLGAVLGGAAGMETYRDLSKTTLNTAFIVGLMSAFTVTVMTWKQLPVSTSQAVVGALIAVGVWHGDVQLGILGKVVICWVGTPIGAMILALVLYMLVGWGLNALHLNMFRYDQVVRWGLVVAGCYGAYALGANNVANVTGAFVGEGMLGVQGACLIGGLSIALGVLTYSRGVMLTVGKGLVKLDAFSALVVILSEGLTVHIYAMVGVPVSTSQAVVGGVLGIGIVKGVRTVNKKVLVNILLAWLSTPVIAFGITYVGCLVADRFGWL